MERIHRPGRRQRRGISEHRRIRHPETLLDTLQSRTEGRRHRAVVLQLEPQHHSHTHQSEQTHHRGDRITLLLAPHHPTERARQRKTDHQQQEHLEPIGPGGRILKRVRRVGVIKPPAVGAELLDRFLAGHRAAGNPLLPTGKGADHLIMQMEVLDRPTGNQHDRGDDRQGQQNPHGAPHQINPEIAQLSDVPAGESAHQRDRDRHTHRRRHEVLHPKASHLDQMPLGRLTRIRLPIGVGHETDRGIPRQPRSHQRSRIIKMQRQPALHQLKTEQHQHANPRKSQNTARIRAPILLRLRIRTNQPIDHPLNPSVPLRAIHTEHVIPQRHMHHRQRHNQHTNKHHPGKSLRHLKPLRKQQRRHHEQRQQHRQHQPNHVLETHSRSTNFCTTPSTAKIPTVNTMNVTAPM